MIDPISRKRLAPIREMALLLYAAALTSTPLLRSAAPDNCSNRGVAGTADLRLARHSTFGHRCVTSRTLTAMSSGNVVRPRHKTLITFPRRLLGPVQLRHESVR